MSRIIKGLFGAGIMVFGFYAFLVSLSSGSQFSIEGTYTQFNVVGRYTGLMVACFVMAVGLLLIQSAFKQHTPRKPYRPQYNREEISAMESELKALKAAYERLEHPDDKTIEEFKKANPRVSSELHIREIIGFKADREGSVIRSKESNLENARKLVR